MVMSPVGHRTKHDYAGKGQQQFTQVTDWQTKVPGQGRKTGHYGHGSCGSWNQEWLQQLTRPDQSYG
jgi:hypothetical protein